MINLINGIPIEDDMAVDLEPVYIARVVPGMGLVSAWQNGVLLTPGPVVYQRNDGILTLEETDRPIGYVLLKKRNPLTNYK